ncbi:MAG: hypothetical protein ACI90V_005855 [Bacillariaceae sp.]|jgi:hypothetical protein
MPAKTLERQDSLSVLTNPSDESDYWNKNNIDIMMVNNKKDRPDNNIKINNKRDGNGNGRRRATSQSIVLIEERLDEAVTDDVQKNRSPDLIPLTADYVQMKKQLRALIVVIITYQKRTRDLHESRFEIAQQLALLSERTPICEEIGCELDGEATEQLQQFSQRPVSSSMSPSLSTSSHSSSFQSASSSSSVISSSASLVASSETAAREVDSSIPNTVSQVAKDYRERSGADILSILGLYGFGAAQAVVNDQEYQIDVVDFVTEWEQIITERVESGLKRVRKLASDRLHYERKIETLRSKANELEIKGRTSPTAAVERLSRNEGKLKQAFTVHEKEASQLCALMESVTHEGYKDIYTLVKNYIKWEINRVGRENAITVQMSATLDSMSAKCAKVVTEKE